MRKVSIQDIAKDMGLSRNTVSKALSNSETVAYDTRQRIIKRAIELGYKKLKPDLRMKIEETMTSKTGNIAVLAHREIADFWNRIMVGISSELNKNNCNLLFSFINKEDEDRLLLPANITNRTVDGVILLSVFRKDYITRIVNNSVPVVFLDAPVEDLEYSQNGDIVLVESENSVYTITKDLITKGRKRLGFIGDITYCRTVFERWQGFLRALNESGIQVCEEVCLVKHASGRYYDEDELRSYLQDIREMPEAFVCTNDDIAISLIRFLKEKGIRVPKDIAVTGFDDTRDSVVVDPALTTVHVYNEQVGRKLVQELMWRIENPDMPQETVIVNTRVVMRESSGM
jgi:LacI family transcriptional regulator